MRFITLIKITSLFLFVVATGFSSLTFGQAVGWKVRNVSVLHGDESVSTGLSSRGCSESSYDINQARTNRNAFIVRKVSPFVGGTYLSGSGHVTVYGPGVRCNRISRSIGFQSNGYGCSQCCNVNTRCSQFACENQCYCRPVRRRCRISCCSSPCNRTFTNYVAECNWGCEDGYTFSASGVGSSPAAARSAAQSTAQGICAFNGHGALTYYGPCTITP